MMGLLNRWRARSRARSAIRRALAEEDPEGIAQWLREYPEEADRIARRAASLADGGWAGHSLVLAVGLARSGRPEAVDLLRRLAGHAPETWRRLEEETLIGLKRYLQERNEVRLFDKVRKRLGDHQLAWLLPGVTEDDFLADFAGVKGARSLVRFTERIADFVEEVALSKRPAGRGLDHAMAAAGILWDRGQLDEALLLWTLVGAVEPALFENPDFLRPVAAALPGWIPRPGSLSVQGLPSGIEIDMSSLPLPPVPPRVTRAADLLADYPRAEWLEPLKRAWLMVEDLVRRDVRNDQLERDPARLMPAQSVAAALGSCAALDHQMGVLVEDVAGRKQRHEALERDVGRRNRLVEKYRKLVDRHHAGENVLDAIRKLQDRIGERDAAIASSREALRGEQTPAALLLHTVNDQQAYPLEVRQAAAWGLHCILKQGALAPEARDRVNETLRVVLHGEKLDESALRDRIAAALPSGDDRLRELLTAGERYAASRDYEQLEVMARRLAPDVPSMPKEIRDGVETPSKSRGQGEFGERMLRVLPGARLLELLCALRRSLRWMVELVEERTADDRSLEEQLPWIVALVGEQLPGVMDFLSRYPLRLMTLDRHRQILGQYTRDKMQIGFWTRFTPPRWFRGADPDDLGRVHRRYLELDDRSGPNAMGLYYRLFEHPVLVLPVLYHEFLHYGGPEGDPKLGIENETEVLLREVLFARHLLARLAPDDAAELAAYEQSLANAIERTELVGLGRQLFYNFADNRSLEAINEQIADSYGEGLEASVAETNVEARIERWNRTIELENAIDEAKRSWFPEIDWPRLDTSETRELTDHYRAVLTRLLQQDHRLGPRRRDQILAEEVCQGHDETWTAYRGQPGAALVLNEHFGRRGLDPLALRAIVHRFELEGPGPVFKGASLSELLGGLVGRS